MFYYTYIFAYKPLFHNFTRLIVEIDANSLKAAEMKFYAKYDAECAEVLSIERVIKRHYAR